MAGTVFFVFFFTFLLLLVVTLVFWFFWFFGFLVHLFFGCATIFGVLVPWFCFLVCFAFFGPQNGLAENA